MGLLIAVNCESGRHYKLFWTREICDDLHCWSLNSQIWMAEIVLLCVQVYRATTTHPFNRTSENHINNRTVNVGNGVMTFPSKWSITIIIIIIIWVKRFYRRHPFLSRITLLSTLINSIIKLLCLINRLVLYSIYIVLSMHLLNKLTYYCRYTCWFLLVYKSASGIM